MKIYAVYTYNAGHTEEQLFTDEEKAVYQCINQHGVFKERETSDNNVTFGVKETARKKIMFCKTDKGIETEGDLCLTTEKYFDIDEMTRQRIKGKCTLPYKMKVEEIKGFINEKCDKIKKELENI